MAIIHTASLQLLFDVIVYTMGISVVDPLQVLTLFSFDSVLALALLRLGGSTAAGGGGVPL